MIGRTSYAKETFAGTSAYAVIIKGIIEFRLDYVFGDVGVSAEYTEWDTDEWTVFNYQGQSFDLNFLSTEEGTSVTIYGICLSSIDNGRCIYATNREDAVVVPIRK